ncbi:MAG TPA: alkaline phosphatase family protein [Actinomycetota bacterium]
MRTPASPIPRSPTLLIVSLFLLSACASPGTTTRGRHVSVEPAVTSATAAEHIVVILMENKEYAQIIGSADAPYLNRLAKRKVLLTQEYAITHPSLPNYLAIAGGSTFGITSDCTDCNVRGRNIIDQLEANGISWKAYMQSMPSPCYKSSSAGTSPNDYAKKHDPFVYFDDVRNDDTRCNRIVPFSQLRTDLKNGLPQFAWITPNECNDMHSCPIATGDAWLKAWVPRIIPALGPNGVVMVLFDEGSSDAACCSLGAGGGHVVAVIAGPGANDSTTIRAAADHYSLLRLIEDEWGFPRLRHAADSTTPTIHGWKA